MNDSIRHRHFRRIDGEDYFVSTDLSLLDLDYTVQLVKQQYWAGWRSKEVIAQSIAGSLSFGLYQRTNSGRDIDPVHSQIGYARIVGDGETFSWLCDTVVDGDHRGKGLGRFLMECVLGHERVKRTVVVLGTRDAHEFYKPLGFAKWEGMRRIPEETG